LLGIKCKVPQNELIDALRQRGMLSVGAGDNVVRILPPLIATEEHVREGIAIINDACQSLSHVPARDAPLRQGSGGQVVPNSAPVASA
jgi:acetylornithine/N-succinyldiaminopimelate aminotransferase